MVNFIERIKTFFQEVITQAKKVDWPTRQEAFRYTLIVLGISAGVAVFLGILDFLFLKILEKFIF